MLRDLLEEIGLEARVMTDPEAAWRTLSAENRAFDVVTLDLRMPVLSGQAFYARLEQHDPAMAGR